LPLSPGRAERQALSITVTALCRFTRPSTPRPGKSWARPPIGTRRRSSSPSSPTSSSTSLGQRDPRDRRQPLGPQESDGQGLPGSASEGSTALHSDVLLTAQPARAVVRQDRTLHPAIQQAPRTVKWKCADPHTISWYRPLGLVFIRRSRGDRNAPYKLVFAIAARRPVRSWWHLSWWHF
jgi:hypothetical protein